MIERLHSLPSKLSIFYRLCVFILSFNLTFIPGIANADPTRSSKWQPYFDIKARLGNERSLGSANVFLPLAQSRDRLLFADARFTFDDSSATEGNLGLAYRHRLGDRAQGGIFGVYGFFDYRKSETNFSYKQLTGGAEWLANDWELRTNLYLPEDNQNTVSSSLITDVALNGTTAIYRVSAQSFMEQALPGYDVEAGYRFGLNDRADIWVLGSYFNFNDTGAPEVSGPRLRVEYRLQNPFGWTGSELGLGLEGQNDDVRGSQGYATAHLRIPLGKANKSRPVLTGLDLRMINPVRRDFDVVTVVDDSPDEEIVSETPITDPGSGEIINVYFVEESGVGDCSQDSPCVVSTAQSDAVYGVADIIVPVSNSGDITSDIQLTLPRQQVVGGGDTGNALLQLSTGDQMVLSGLGARPTLGATLSMSDASFAAGFNINNPNTVAALSANTITSAGVRDINILGSDGAGFEFINASGIINIENSNSTNASGAGLSISGGDATVVLTNVAINDTDSGRSVDIQNTSGGSIRFDNASRINNNGGSGLLINNIGGNINFDAAVSVSGATSNAVTATNLNTNIVAFNGALDIATINGDGLTASNGILNIADTASTISATNGSALNLNTITVGNGSGGALNFASLNANGGATGITLTRVNAMNGLAIGTATLDNHSTAGININTLTGSLNILNSLDINAAAIGVLSDNSGEVTVTGMTHISNTGTAAIRVTAGETGHLRFADVLIDNAAQAGIDISGANGTLELGNVDMTNFGGSVGMSTASASTDVTIASLDITGTGAANSTGVDITGSTGRFTVTNAGTIQNVVTAFELDSLGTGTTNATLSYQNGNINAGIPVNTVGITAGSYDFTDTSMTKNNALSTDTGFDADFWFADATGGGTGTSTDRASIDFIEANSGNNAIILLVDDGTGNLLASNGLQLKANQQLLGFAAGDATVDFTGSNAQVIGTFAYSISDPTGNGAATLSNSGGTEVVTLADNSRLRDFGLVTNGAVDAVAGSGFTNSTINNIAIANVGAEAFDFSNASGTITIENSSATNSSGAGVRINGGDATVVLTNVDINDTVSGRSVDIQNTSGGSISFDATSRINNNGGSGLFINNIGGNINFDAAVSVNGATSNAVTATNLNSNTVAFNGALDISTTNGSGLSASNGTLNIADTATTISTTNGGALNLNNITVGNGSGGALNFASLVANGGANGILLSNVTATNGLSITNATLANNTTAGLNISGVSGTLNITAADVDAAAAATGVTIAGVNGTINIGTDGTGLEIDGGTTGVSINQSAGTVNLGNGASGGFALDGSSGTGVSIAGTGTVNIGTGGGSATIGATADTGGTAFVVNGGSVDATYAGSIALASNVGLVSVQAGHSGTLIFSGALSNSAATNATQLNFNNADGVYNFDATVDVNTSAGVGVGIDIVATSGGTIDFNNSLAITTASGDAIRMDGTGNLNIKGGELTINTTGGTAISATGGGTLNITGDNNSIATNTGTALNINNTTIGTDHLNFRSVFVNGASIGIALNNTGVSGGLNITGDGLTSHSGGTIQNTSGAGISLTNTHNVNLNYIEISNTGAAGITGNTVEGFTLQGSIIQNTIGHNVGLSEVTGVIDISNNTLLDANEDGGSDFLDENNGIDISNTAGTIASLTVANNIIQGTSGTTSDVGVALHLDGTAVLTSATLSQNTIQDHDFHAIRISLDNDDSGDAPVITNLEIINNVILSSESTAIELNARGSSDLNFAASNNAQINSDFGNGIQINAGLFAVGGNSTASVAGSIMSNTITNIGDGVNDRGIDILSQESSAVVVNIDDNNISNVSNGGIALRVRDTSLLDAIINNNTLTNTDSFGGDVLGLFAETRETSSGCFSITNNNNALTYQLNQSAGTLFNLEPLLGNTGTVNTSGILTSVAIGTCQRLP